jgi:hypothetical protein
MTTFTGRILDLVWLRACWLRSRAASSVLWPDTSSITPRRSKTLLDNLSGGHRNKAQSPANSANAFIPECDGFVGWVDHSTGCAPALSGSVAMRTLDAIIRRFHGDTLLSHFHFRPPRQGAEHLAKSRIEAFGRRTALRRGPKVAVFSWLHRTPFTYPKVLGSGSVLLAQGMSS